MKTLFIIRGLPGSGKSTLATQLTTHSYEADMYFDFFTNGEFNAHLLKDAHEWCRNRTEQAMASGVEKVAVSNTFTQAWEMAPYYELAQKFGYTVHQIIVENTHGKGSIHDIPQGTFDKMRARFEVKL